MPNEVNMGPGMSVTYKDPVLRRECGIFKILPCECYSCQNGDTHLVNLPSIVSSGSFRHVGHEMIEPAISPVRVF